MKIVKYIIITAFALFFIFSIIYNEISNKNNLRISKHVLKNFYTKDVSEITIKKINYDSANQFLVITDTVEIRNLINQIIYAKPFRSGHGRFIGDNYFIAIYNSDGNQFAVTVTVNYITAIISFTDNINFSSSLMSKDLKVYLESKLN